MNIEFQHPLYFLILIPCIILTVIPFVKLWRRKRGQNRHIVSFICRILAFIMIMSALAGITTVRKADKNSVIVVADLSDSTKSVREQYEEYFKKAQKYANKKTTVGLITFGYDSVYEIPLSTKLSFKEFETSPAGNYTDIYSALTKAVAMMPEGTNKKIILLTDGKQNINDVQNAANLLLKRNIRLDAIISEIGNAEYEIQLSDIDIPSTVYQGENFGITLTVESTRECTAELTLYKDKTVSAKQEVKLTKGTNRFVFKDTAESAGITNYSAEISLKNDAIKKNNSIYSFINVLGSPEILIVDGTGNESHELVKILNDTVKFTVVSSSAVPDNISDLRKYDAVILMNTLKSQLPDDWDSLLEVYVRQLGRGVFTTGGSHSYALGGWSDTKLESILPVDMYSKDETKLVDMALMLLIDNSGSMGGGRGSSLELAKQGAINAVESIKAIDEAGVIAFSDNAVWISKLTEGSKKENIQKKIASIREGGGTMLHSSLVEAYNALKDSKKSVKNVILLTDGQPADEDMIRKSKIVEKMAEEQIKVSCIAVGEYAETGILKYIANTTGGSCINARDTEDLPNIIYEETVKLSNEGYCKNITFTPKIRDYINILSEVKGIPELDGYVVTEVKDMAYNILEEAEDGKTVLAAWQYGLGKTASLTTDLNGKWSSKLLASENGRTLINNIISWILPTEDTDENGKVEITRKGDKGIISVVGIDSEVQYDTSAVIISPTGKEISITLIPTGIGEYSGEFYLEEEGSYVVIANQKDSSGSIVMSKENALAVKYSDEYDMFIKNDGSVEKICLKTGGSADWDNIEGILDAEMPLSETNRDFTVPLIIIAICLTMLDIALRRLDLSLIFGKIRKKSVVKAAHVENVKPQKRELAEKKKTEIPKAAENHLPEKNKEQYVKKEEKSSKEDDPSSSISSLLKEKQNMKRKKM